MRPGVRTMCVGGALALAASTTGAQTVRVIERQSIRSDSLVERVFVANVSDVKRMVAAWREREERLVKELRGVPEADFPARRRLEAEIGQHTRDGFAMMSAIQSRCADEGGPRPAGYLGVNLTTEFTLVNREPKALGSLVTSVEPGSPAEKAGVQADDRLVAIGGLDARERLPDLIELLVPGRTLVVRVEREGVPRDLSLTVARRPEGFGESCDEFARELLPMHLPSTDRIVVRERAPGDRRTVVESRQGDPRPAAGEEMRLMIFGPGGENRTVVAFFAGAEFRALDEDWREVLGVKQGVIVSEVASGSAAALAGLKGGDVITAVGKSAVTSPVVLVQLLGVMEPREATLAVVRGKEKKSLTLRWGSR